MNSRPLILSFPASHNRDESVWCQEGLALGNILIPNHLNFALEIQAKRLDYDGHFEDNPPLGRVDALMQNTEEKQLRFGCVFVPVNLNQPDDQIGNEISAINGWTDLTVYSGIGFVRLELAGMSDLNSKRTHDALKQILNYMLDMDLKVSISFPEPPLNEIKSFWRNIDEGMIEKGIGIERKIEIEELIQTEKIEIDKEYVTSICATIDTPIPTKSIEKFLSVIDHHFPKESPALVIMVNNLDAFLHP